MDGYKEGFVGSVTNGSLHGGLEMAILLFLLFIYSSDSTAIFDKQISFLKVLPARFIDSRYEITGNAYTWLNNQFNKLFQ